MKYYQENSIKADEDTVVLMTEKDAVIAFVKEVGSEFGAPSILVNNAGITKDGLAMRMKSEQFMDVIDANLKSTFIRPLSALHS